MRYEVIYPGAFPVLRIVLATGEAIKAEAAALLTVSGNAEIEGKLDGGLFGGIKRMIAGESFFMQTISAQSGEAEVLLAQAAPGDIIPLQMDGQCGWLVHKDGFLAGTMAIEVGSSMQNMGKGFLSGQGFFVVALSGKGVAFLSSYGGIHRVDLAAGEERLVSTGHLVAWPETMNYSLEKAAKSWLSSIKSGELLLCRMRGPGSFYVQTRNPNKFGEWMTDFIRFPKNSG